MRSINSKKTKFTFQGLKREILVWNGKHPFDRWWREKYNIPFGSEQHLNTDFINQKIQFIEEMIIKEIDKKEKQRFEIDERVEVRNDKGIEKYLRDNINEEASVKMKKQEIDKTFDDLDISKF